MISSMSDRIFGFGSSILRMTGRHARGERLLMVGGQADCDGVLQAETYAANNWSVGCATVHGSSWKCRQ